MKYINGKVYYRNNEERELLGYLANKLRCPLAILNKRREYVDGLILNCADVHKISIGEDNEFTQINKETGYINRKC